MAQNAKAVTLNHFQNFSTNVGETVQRLLYHIINFICKLVG